MNAGTSPAPAPAIPLPNAAASHEPQGAAIASAPSITRAAASPLHHPPVAAPLAPGRYRFQFTSDEEMHELFRQVQTLLCREIPNGDVVAIFRMALALLHEHTARKKLAATGNPRRRHRPHDVRSRYRPADLIRIVWKRDGGRCAYVAMNGRRCDETKFLEFHHLVPYARGGEMTPANISLRCSAHNRYEAELVFGPYAAKVHGTRAVDTSNGPQGSSGRNQLRATLPGES
jgi:hypothetical protein